MVKKQPNGLGFERGAWYLLEGRNQLFQLRDPVVLALVARLQGDQDRPYLSSSISRSVVTGRLLPNCHYTNPGEQST